MVIVILPLFTAALSPHAVAAPGLEQGATDPSTKIAPEGPLNADPEAKPSIAANLPPADFAVAQKLQDILAGTSQSIFDRKEERTVVQTFYRERGFAPLWLTNGIPNPRARSAISRLKQADTDGLDPADYPTPDFAAVAGRPEALAEAELNLTRSSLTYARHAQIGRVHYSRISGDIAYHLVAIEPTKVLADLPSVSSWGR